MNKGVIVQLEPNAAHILRNDGAFVSCSPDPRWQVGDVVTISRRPTFSVRAVLISCAVITLVLFGAGTVLYNMPVTYIEISLNPSVQMTLNRFDRVLSVTGLNTDGEELLQGMSYKNLTLYEAYARLFNRLENNGYLGGATVQLVVANNSQRNLDSIEQTLRSVSEKYIAANNIKMSIKRYANDEYLSLEHPLPVVEIPEPSSESPSGQQSETPPSVAPSLPPIETTVQPSSTPTPQPENTPTPQPTETPTPQPSSTPEETPSSMPGHGSGHNGGMHGGQWQNGWWDWDCGPDS